VLAAGIGTVAPPTSARADTCGDYQVCSPSPDTVVKLAFALFKIGKGGLTAADLEALILEAVGLMQSAQNEVIAHTDNVLVQNALGRMRTLLIEAKSYQHLRENEILLWTLYDKALTTINDSYSVYRSVTDLKGKDDVARAVLVEYPVAVAAIGDYAQQFDPDGGPAQYKEIEDDFIDTLRSIRTQLEPQCHRDVFPTDLPEYNANVVCVAATGRVAIRNEHWANGEWVTPPVNEAMLKREAGIGSAWLEAVQVLESLGL
jgi:hypothetical protein